MRKRVSVVLTMVLFAAIMGGWSLSKGYESQKKSSGLNVTLKADRYPLVNGDNALTLSVTDSAGKAVTDATVDIRFYMPPMPGMAPMEDRLQARPKGSAYPFTVNVAMGGGWKVETTVTVPGKDPVTVTFNLDAR